MVATHLQPLETQFEKQLPFVVFALPNSTEASFYLQHQEVINPVGEGYFLFAPFDKTEVSFKIFFDVCTSFSLYFNSLRQAPTIEIPAADAIEKKKHLDLVHKAVTAIHQKEFDKVIASRRVGFTTSNFKLSVFIEHLMRSHQDAFRYVWFHPDTGLWSGATPEVLFQANKGSVETMALAGTRSNEEGKTVVWGSKEEEEHQFVTDAIVQELQNVLSEIQISKTYTQKAGPVVHLRTDIKGAIPNEKVTVLHVAEKLHPTPAVCGTPRTKAHQFILLEEPYNREFYTGYLGPVWHASNKANLFVNLRCMKIEHEKAYLYVGGGITKDSNPEAEWEETQNKMKTMLQVLTPFL